MAAVDVVIAVPPPPVPVPVLRMSRLTLAAADAAVCLRIASLWVFFASVGAALIEVLACGWGCTGTTAAWMAALFSLLLFVLLFALCPWAALKVPQFDYYINQLKKAADALEPINEAFVNAHVIAIAACAFLEFFGLLLKLVATNDTSTARIASAIIVLAPLGICVMCCLVSIPGLAVRVWRIRRHGRASVVPI